MRKAHRPLTCLLTYEVIFPLSTEFPHYSLLYIISSMGVIVFSQSFLSPFSSGGAEQKTRALTQIFLGQL